MFFLFEVLFSIDDRVYYSKIKPNLSDDNLDDELHQIKRKFDKDVKADNKKFLEKIEKGFDSDYEYKQFLKNKYARLAKLIKQI